ncbi:MAG: N,N-dimethylformamidase beta subunit family domain-containing protein, partial [Solirubrobacterales bacterium]
MTGLRAGVLALALLLLGGAALLPGTALAGPCDPPNNEIVCENSKAGTPSSTWDVNGAGDSSIQGFSTDISVDQGQTARFKIKTVSTKYRIDIYRMGYYGGSGARKVATVSPSVGLPQSQPACSEQAATGLVDCGNWAESASWAVPASAVSGIYFAHLVREDKSSEGSHVFFIVRDDDGNSDVLFQTSDTTWQAYNEYGGKSLYMGGPGSNPSRAYKVSYNRPLTVRETGSEDAPFNAEYPMVRWLERNGYDISYTTGIDSDRRGAEILEHDLFLSVGHDEYWSGAQRANVEAARDAGVNLAFFSGNEVFWKTRWENSTAGPVTSYRTLVCYKETHANAKIDPAGASMWTGTWRDPRFSPPADGGRPENELTGTSFAVNSGTAAIEVPGEDAGLRLWRNTDITELALGETTTLGEDTLGYEWDEDPDNGFRPAGLVPLSSTTVNVPQKLLDYGSNYGPGDVSHSLTLYRADSDALVFGAGTVQWSWGLDGEHDRGNDPPDSRMQQATVNLFADMGVQPGTLQAGLVAATESTDTTPPVTSISTPIDEMEVSTGQPFTIKGHASDSEGEGNGGGEVGAVEVSVDEGETWHLAEGTDPWSYDWTPGGLGAATIMARAVDDSGNLETPGDEVTVNVVAHACPCTIWDKSFSGPQDNDSKAIELGVKFRADVAGFISGIRFYKTAGNTGTHVGRLWTLGGTQLGQVTFTGESGTGWQEAHFENPVAINAGTTYIAAYHAPVGRYASIEDYFKLVGTDNPPLHALADGVDGPNGIYKYGAAGGLFASGGPNTFHSENYLVDVVFEKKLAPDTTPPIIGNRSPVDKATEVARDVMVSASFDEAMNPATISGSTVQLKDPLGTLVPASVSYDAGLHKATLDPTESLEYATTYTATVKGGPTGVADVAGNHLVASSSWSFTTVAPPPPPPDEGPGGPILVIANAANPFSRYYAEILRAEGLNQFTITEITNLTPALIAKYDVAILGEGPVSAGQTTTLTNWVQAGGNLIAMRPEGKLASLLGINSAGSTLANAYLKVDTASTPGIGIVGDTVQFHGTADRYTTAGAQAVATLYSNASTSTPNPAVTLRDVGSNGGQAAAFTYDLAKSVVYTRQGNPAWDAQERDGLSPVRSNDLYYGAKAGDVQPDWVDLNKVEIPQADEQQRLLTNLIERMNVDRKPLPRFWFLPYDYKAAVVMTGDDHGNNGTTGRLEHHKALDPPGCVVAKWQCVRSTSYIYPNTPISDTKAAAFVAEGFEIGVHITTGCRDWDDQKDLETVYSNLLSEFATKFPSVPSPTTNRMHCIVWTDWATQPKVELKNGIRLDTTYYYWPAAWVQNRPGMFTGSGMPMRFANIDGSLIDVYQAATQMTDESAQTYPFNADKLLDNALGAKGFYGAFVANMHTDKVVLPESDAIIASAQARGVPIVSARQMLTWLDGRNQSSFGSIGWSGNELSFTISPGSGASGLRAMVPTSSAVGPLSGLKRGGTPVTTTTSTIKGIEYAFFDATAGSYTATYAAKASPVISNVQAQAKNDGTATVTWDTNESATSRVDYGTSAGSLPFNVSNSSLVASHSLQLSGLEPDTTYHFRVTSVDSEANSVTEPDLLLSPKTFVTPPAAPLLSAVVPTSPANQNSPKVVGSAAAGTTVNLYAGSGCSGSPVATVTAAGLAAGIAVSVADNSTTSFRATAASGAGTSACSAPIVYVEDSNAPETQIDTKPAAIANSTTANFAFSGSDPGGSGIASFECRRDGGAWSACTSPQEYTGLAEGNHSFEVKAIDKAGNTDSTPATYSWTVDSKAPETQIDTKPAALVNVTTANFAFSGSDPGGSGIASFECRRDGGAWSACTSPLEYTGLLAGAHSFEVKAIDKAGNVDSTPATYNWQIDLSAPAVTIDSLSKALLKAGETSDVTWHANENGSFELRVGGADCTAGTVVASGAYANQPATQVSNVT